MKKEFIRDILMNLGLDPSLLGFWMIIDAEMHLIEEPDRIHAITKEVYPFVAKANKSTVSKVERNIRHAKIKTLDEDISGYIAEVLNLSNCIHRDGDVTNTRFLAALMVYIKKQEEMETENASK